MLWNVKGVRGSALSRWGNPMRAIPPRIPPQTANRSTQTKPNHKKTQSEEKKRDIPGFGFEGKIETLLLHALRSAERSGIGGVTSRPSLIIVRPTRVDRSLTGH